MFTFKWTGFSPASQVVGEVKTPGEGETSVTDASDVQIATVHEPIRSDLTSSERRKTSEAPTMWR